MPWSIHHRATGQHEQHHGNRYMIGFADEEWHLGDQSFVCWLHELAHDLLTGRRQLEHPPRLKIRYGTAAESDC